MQKGLDWSNIFIISFAYCQLLICFFVSVIFLYYFTYVVRGINFEHVHKLFYVSLVFLPALTRSICTQIKLGASLLRLSLRKLLCYTVI